MTRNWPGNARQRRLARMQLPNKLKKRRKSISRPPQKEAPNTENYIERGVEIFSFVFQLGLTSQPASPSPRTSSTPGSTSTRYMYRIPLLLYKGLGSSGECTSSRTRNKTHHFPTFPPSHSPTLPLSHSPTPPLSYYHIFSLSHTKKRKNARTRIHTTQTPAP